MKYFLLFVVACSVAAAQQARLTPEEERHQKAAVSYVSYYVSYKFTLGSLKTIPGTARVTVSSTIADGGWGQHVTKGTVFFDYLDGFGKRQSTRREYAVITEPKKGTVAPADITLTE